MVIVEREAWWAKVWRSMATFSVCLERGLVVVFRVIGVESLSGRTI